MPNASAVFWSDRACLERDEDNSYLSEAALDDDPMNALLGHSVTYRIAVGPLTGRKVFSLQILPSSDEPGTDQVAGFSLHAGVAARANERNKLERLCRYITRPALSEKRLSLTDTGQVRYELKTSYRDGTTPVFVEPLDFTAPAHPCARGISASLHVMAKLAVLVPKPSVNLTRFHGVFAPNSQHRVQVTPAKRGKGRKPQCTDNTTDQTASEQHTAMTWAQRLKRVFGFDIETCRDCGGAVKVIACIEDPVVIKQLLAHREKTGFEEDISRLPESRAPLQAGLFDFG